MKLQQLAFPALATLLSLLVGCAPKPAQKLGGPAAYREGEAMYCWGRSSFFFLNSRGPFDPPDHWCRTANDQNLSPDGRRVAAAILFAAYVKPGFNTDDMRKTITAGVTLFGVRGGVFTWFILAQHRAVILDFFTVGQGLAFSTAGVVICTSAGYSVVLFISDGIDRGLCVARRNQGTN